MTLSPSSGRPFEASGFFVLRTPLLAVEEVLAWSEGLEASGPDPAGRRPGALERDRGRLRMRLRDILRRPEVSEAILVASPTLEESMAHWLREPDSSRGRKAELVLVRYIERMATRATPFGLFAGESLGRLAERTRLELAASSEYVRHTRLDGDYMFALGGTLARDPERRAAFRYRPNATLSRTGGRWRYVESRFIGRARTHHLVAVEDDPAIAAAVERAREGSSFEDLVSAAAATGLSGTDAEACAAALVDHQILASDAVPPLTGPEPVRTLAEQLGGHPATREAGGRLAEAQRLLEALDRDGLGRPRAAYEEIVRVLEGLPVKPELARLFQVDLGKPSGTFDLGLDVVEEIARGAEILADLAAPPSETLLEEFRERFVERYGAREVPLLEALDEEAGVPLVGSSPTSEPSPLLEGITFLPPGDMPGPRWRGQHAILQMKILEAAEARRQEIVLDERDLAKIRAPGALPLPEAFAVMASLIGSPSDVDEGKFTVLIDWVTGPSGARLMGRFCHGNRALEAEVRRHLQAEEALHPEAVYAEVVYLPQGRMGNVLLRPVLRDYEIPFLGRSGASPERQIALQDLNLSVIDRRLMLRSRRLGREIIPRLTSAHNYGRGIPLYRFLGALQEQNSPPHLSWNWGPLGSLPFLPRVSTGRLVLSRAQWNVAASELKALSTGAEEARWEAAHKWRADRRLPRWVALADDDNELVVDLENVLSLETFVTLVKKRPAVRLVEMLPSPESLAVRGPEGTFLNELIVPFVGVPGRIAPRARAPVVRDPAARRMFPPGSEWLYFKLYGGTGSLDRAIREMAPVATQAVSAGDADRWFFIRYGDPDWHLRFRIHGPASSILGSVFPAFRTITERLLLEGLLSKVQLDTYERESERYGGDVGMELAERLFHIDSEAVSEILSSVRGDEGQDVRWRLALIGMDLLLDDLGFAAEVRAGVVANMRSSFRREFKAGPWLDRQIGPKFRGERRALLDLFSGRADRPALSRGLAALRARTGRLAPLGAELRRAARSGRLSAPPEHLAESFLHMYTNRLLRSSARAQELVLYDFLLRHYESEAARTRAVEPKVGLPV